MKPKARQPSSGDVKSRPKRESSRIAVRRKQVDTSQKPLTTKAPSKNRSVTQIPLVRKKAAAAESKQTSRRKPTPLKTPEDHRPPLDLKVLREHDRTTANDPLPQDLAEVKEIS
jgi:hypothetical protein